MSGTFNQLKTKISKKKASVGILGLGYVGLPLAFEFIASGFTVKGLDIDQKRVEQLSKGRSYIEDLSDNQISRLAKSRKFEAGTDYEILKDVDAIIVCVPTPLNRSRDPDISLLLNAVKEIAKGLRKGQLIIVESTTYPGTTEDVVLPELEKSKLKVGKDFFLCFSPERIDPGNQSFGTNNIPKVIGGITKRCSELASVLYKKILSKTVLVSSPRTAEMAKLLENTFRIVNIGLINELACASEKLGVDIWEAIEAAKTKPFGYMPFYPGPGIGGHCIGVDPLYLSWKARLEGLDLHFIELARRQNASMPSHIVSRVVMLLSQHAKKAISKSKILILGVAYKKNVGDTRESPALEILKELKDLGATIAYHDPYVSNLKVDNKIVRGVGLSPTELKKHDLVLLLTDHDAINKDRVIRSSRLIFDTRNFFRGKDLPKIIAL